MKRADSPDQFLSNQSNQQAIDNIIKLRKSIEEKRKHLDKIYLEAAGRDENSEVKPNMLGVTIIKKVNFEPAENRNESKIGNYFNSTFTVTKIPQQKDINSFRSKNFDKNKKSNQDENDQKCTLQTQKIQKSLSRPSNRQVFTYHQKKLIEKEKNQTFEANLKQIRDKILTRKFAYIWLRKHLNKRKFLSNHKIILPSEAQ